MTLKLPARARRVATLENPAAALPYSGRSAQARTAMQTPARYAYILATLDSTEPKDLLPRLQPHGQVHPQWLDL